MAATWSLQFLPATKDDLAALDKRAFKNVIRRLEWLAANFDQVAHERLSADLKNDYKLRAGDYRAVYQFNNRTKIILVLKIGHRSKIYKS